MTEMLVQANIQTTTNCEYQSLQYWQQQVTLISLSFWPNKFGTLKDLKQPPSVLEYWWICIAIHSPVVIYNPNTQCFKTALDKKNMVLLLVFYTFIIGWMGWLAGWVEDITGGKGCQGIKKH